MTAIALKKYLVSRINLIDDDSILNKIKKIIDKKEEVYVLSENQLDKLDRSKKHFINGEFHTQEEVDLIVEKWLNEQ